MNADVTDLAIQLVYALGAWERGEPGAQARHQALRERLKRMATARWGAHPCRPLRLVHDDGAACMRRSGLNDAEMRKPKLALVYSRD